MFAVYNPESAIKWGIAVTDDRDPVAGESDQGKVSADDKAPFLSDLEARVIGVLMEKLLATPNNYPLTINSLTLGCNQKSNREPVMNLTEGQVVRTVNQLDERRLVRLEYGERANKVSHRVADKFSIDRRQQAILAVLFLRSPQTLNELKTRTARMASFDSTEDLSGSLQEIMVRDEPLVVMIPKGPGRREDRYAHTLCGDVDIAALADGSGQSATRAGGGRVSAELDQRVAALEARMAALEQALGIAPDEAASVAGTDADAGESA